MTIYYDAGTILKSVGALTEQDAIQLISNVLAQYRGILQEHQAIQNALQLLIDKVNEPKVEIKAEEIEEVK